MCCTEGLTCAKVSCRLFAQPNTPGPYYLNFRRSVHKVVPFTLREPAKLASAAAWAQLPSKMQCGSTLSLSCSAGTHSYSATPNFNYPESTFKAPCQQGAQAYKLACHRKKGGGSRAPGASDTVQPGTTHRANNATLLATHCTYDPTHNTTKVQVHFCKAGTTLSLTAFQQHLHRTGTQLTGSTPVRQKTQTHTCTLSCARQFQNHSALLVYCAQPC